MPELFSPHELELEVSQNSPEKERKLGLSPNSLAPPLNVHEISYKMNLGLKKIQNLFTFREEVS